MVSVNVQSFRSLIPSLSLSVILIVFDYIQVSLNLYIQQFERNDRYRTYCTTQYDPLLHFVFGYFSFDKQRTIYQLYNYLSYTDAISDCERYSEIVELWTEHGATNLNPFCLLKKFIGHVSPMNLKKLLDSNRNHMKVFRCIDPHANQSIDILNNYKSLKCLTIDNPVDMAKFKILKKTDATFFNHVERLESCCMVHDPQIVKSLLTLPNLIYFHIHSAIGLLSINGFENVNMRKLDLWPCKIPDACARSILSAFPNLKILKMQARSAQTLQLLFQSNVTKLNTGVKYIDLFSDSACEALAKNRSIQSLKLQSISDSVLPNRIMVQLAKNSTIRKLSFIDYNISNEQMEKLLLDPSVIHLDKLVCRPFSVFHDYDPIVMKHGLTWNGGAYLREYKHPIVVTTSQLSRNIERVEKYDSNDQLEFSLYHNTGIARIRTLAKLEKEWNKITIWDNKFDDQCLNELIKYKFFDRCKHVRIEVSGMKQGLYYLAKQEKIIFGSGNKLMGTSHYI
jgi:hypothetical protein